MYKRKWKDSGEKFKDFDELINSKVAIFMRRITVNQAWIISQQVRWLEQNFKSFTKAARNDGVEEEQ